MARPKLWPAPTPPAPPHKRLELAGARGVGFLEDLLSPPTEEPMMFRYGGLCARSSSADR